jgi:hypothetical protein
LSRRTSINFTAPRTSINKEAAVTEKLATVNGVGDTPNMHDILTGSQPDGTAFAGQWIAGCIAPAA